ncbi:MAG: hypothetical protein H0U44_00215 [Flavisolibacter sp.]|jgi:hypothetical protein|nr:hypothetical protein [Flavisolibacter sp.]
MKLLINSSSTLAQVKKISLQCFHSCALIFLKTTRHGKGSLPKDLYSNEATIASIAPALKEMTLEFKATDSVGHFEQLAQNQLCIPVQVFRKGGQIWLETILTDHLSLEKQNKWEVKHQSPSILMYTVFSFNWNESAITKQPVNDHKNNDGSKTATTYFTRTVSCYNCSEPSWHNLKFKWKD